MLARSFKAAVDLGISEEEREALITVLGMSERGEINTSLINMSVSSPPEPDCGTPSCICGWARYVAARRIFIPPWEGKPQSLRDLFLMGPVTKATEPFILQLTHATSDHVAHAISNYLTTGEPRWAEVLA